ncbi:hypothetical protein ACIBBE_11530 [Streptomyces sp. NPDC051644]|uniref:hypothetical protein n=1 Tax=Streptomyces sp. NPDC051644 TaxID=3365666 RepID=UPI0037B0D3FB
MRGIELTCNFVVVGGLQVAMNGLHDGRSGILAVQVREQGVQVNDPRVGWLVEVFKGFRAGDGLTTDKVRKEPELIRLLIGDGTAEEAKAALEAIVLSRGDGDRARALRNSLVVSDGQDGIKSRGGPELRRKWATGEDDITRPRGDLLVAKSFSSHVLYEKAEFEELAKLILDRADQRARVEANKDAFQEHGRQGLREAGHAEAFVPVTLVRQYASAEPEEPNDQPASPAESEKAGFIRAVRGAVGRWTLPTGREHFGQLALVATGGVGLVFAITLLLTGVIPLGSKAHPAADKVESATVPSGVTVRGSAAPKLDNSRGWGPVRKKTYTWKHPASFPVFNSITDNPYHGDERNFLQCKDTEKDGQSWGDELVAKDGHTYECYLYIGNDVAANLDTNVAARLQNARIHLSLPDERTLNPGITGILSADNAPQVWDSCNFVAARPVTLIYESGSARLHTNATPKDGSPLPGATDGLIQDSGALLGDKGDGIVGQNAGYLTFQMTAVLG